jgi:AcrR family transcriptional regulator
MSPTSTKAPERRSPARKSRRRAAEPAAEATRASLTPETWIEAATQVLVDQGIDHVRVDVLATQLAVTRGSFYWHFRDREDLLRRVLQAWRERATELLTRRLESAWARRDEMARQAVDEADAARIAYHTQVFGALGFAPEEAAQRGFVLYSYEVAESLLTRQGTAAQKQARSAFMLRLATQPLGG